MVGSMRKTAGTLTERIQSGQRAPQPASLEGLLVAGLSKQLAEPLFEQLAELFGPLLEARDKPALLSKKDLARELGICTEGVDRLRREGCPELRVGDLPRFELEAVLGWLRTRAESERAARSQGHGSATR
jgi:hypothetical protein